MWLGFVVVCIEGVGGTVGVLVCGGRVLRQQKGSS